MMRSMVMMTTRATVVFLIRRGLLFVFVEFIIVYTSTVLSISGSCHFFRFSLLRFRTSRNKSSKCRRLRVIIIIRAGNFNEFIFLVLFFSCLFDEIGGRLVYRFSFVLLLLLVGLGLFLFLFGS